MGVLFVDFRTPQAFAEPQRHLIGGLANYAAIAIKNAREFGAQSRRQIQQLERLQSIDRQLDRLAELAPLLNEILRIAVAQVGAEAAAVLLYSPRRRELKVEAAVGRHAESRLGTIVPAEGKGISMCALQEKRPMLVDDVNASEWRNRFFDVGGDTVSELDVPLLSGGEAIGVLNFESPRARAFQRKDVEFLETLANQAVLTIQKAQAFEKERRLADDREALINLGKELTRQLDVRDLLGLIVRHALKLTRSGAGILALRDDRSGDLVVEAEVGYANSDMTYGNRIGLTQGIIGFVARQGEVVNAGDVTQPPWDKIYRSIRPDVRSELAVPLKLGTSLRGVLNVETPRIDHYGERDERLLLALADFAVIALVNAERYRETDRQRRRLKDLHQAGHEVLRQTEDPDRVLRALVQFALHSTDASRADLDLYVDRVLTAVYAARLEPDQKITVVKQFDLSLGVQELPPMGIMRYVADTSRSYLTVGDAKKDPLYAEDPAYAGSLDIRCELAIPLLNGSGELLGVLNVESERVDAFDASDREILELLSAQAAIALENIRNFELAERERQRFELLRRAGRQLARITDLSQIDRAYEIVLLLAEERCHSQVVIRRIEPALEQGGKPELVLKGQASADGPLIERHPGDRGLNGWVATEHRTIVIRDAAHPPPGVEVLRSDLRDHSFIVTPIKFEESYYGNLALSHSRVNYFQGADIELIEGLAQQLAITIHRLEEVEAHREAEQQALANGVMAWIGWQAEDYTHTLGNYLGLLPGDVDLLREELKKQGIDDLRVERRLRELEADVENARSLARELAKRIAEHGPGEPVTIPARQLAEEALQSLRLRNDKIEIRRELGEDLGSVRVVYTQITSALLNLLTNAVEAMPGGGVLTVGGSNQDPWVRLWVRDTGGGIPPEKIPELFRLNFPKANDAGPIRGFGLAIVQYNVKQNKGWVEVQSEPGKGSTFNLFLPRAASL